ncbi:ribosomal-protein-alanine N-acetyltransferase [Cytobacillus eiseniae]|uniref:Ribosomal-protein-alanine N-acetyltransferase n=1 Tax=Cytobacillus eiseniae TaxID=762947 RepID=A0ABS4RGK1_9BACI|nr:GNAT family protein [Cytobacillus eiseniae]MBP2242023.1 ribosomal-protein-alanine N-acetyltransferase [Cytobacillus eiseniae]
MTNEVETFPVLETDRLILRKIEKSDANSILKYLSDKEVMEFYGLEPFKTVDDALNEISWYQSIVNEGTGIRWGITLKGEDEVIGSCGFLNMVPQHFRTEIGFELSKSYWGQGIASEALEAVITYGFSHLNFQRIEALIEPPNMPSQKVTEKQGFIREGLLRNYEFTCGKFDDLYLYSLLKQDFEALQNEK